MLKSLFPQIAWERIEAVGFDLDGTLYDELEFILQVYRPIAEYLCRITGQEERDVYQRMVFRWLEKGSSYNRIFDEILCSGGIEGKAKESAISQCLDIFRHFKPELLLSNRVKLLLEHFKKHYQLFLISDGQSLLQRAKLASLGLEQWIAPENIVISGDYGPEFQKPSVAMAEQVAMLKAINPEHVVFFGDREVDALFAQNAGFKFILVKIMQAGVMK